MTPAAPTVTTSDILTKIKETTYTLLPDGRTTICQITLANGYTIIGKSACVCVENYNQALGEKYAFEDAINKIWELEGYLLKEQLYWESRGDANQYAQEQAEQLRAHLDELYEALGVSAGENPFHVIKGLGVSANQEFIARLCHEVNRAYCEALGDTSQLSWEQAPQWQRESARMGVDFHLSGNFGPEASHLSWMSNKLSEGWKYGPVKDADKKEHPCMVPFDQLPKEQQAKDYIFRAVVHSFSTAKGV